MIVFTDGSFNPKPQMAGLGAVILNGEQQHTIGCYSTLCTDNNVAEVAAIAMAIQYIDDYKIAERTTDKTLTIISDSQYALHRILNNGDGRSQYEQEMLDYIKKFSKESKLKVHFMQVKGHQNSDDKIHTYNNMADRIAGEYRKIGLEIYRERSGRKISRTLTNFIFNKKNR